MSFTNEPLIAYHCLCVQYSGLLLDIKYGNLLKLDSFANILVCVHGRTKLTQSEMIERYPSRFITVDQIGSNKRFMALNTLYEITKLRAPALCITNIPFDLKLASAP